MQVLGSYCKIHTSLCDQQNRYHQCVYGMQLYHNNNIDNMNFCRKLSMNAVLEYSKTDVTFRTIISINGKEIYDIETIKINKPTIST